MENQEDLAKILTWECGKPLAEAMGEIGYGAAFFEFYAEEAKRIYGDVMPAPMGNRRIVTLKQPVGVCAFVTPWNFPNAMITRKVGPAIAAGCGTVIKPAEDTPLSALALCELANRAGLPPGLINVLTGPKSAAPAIGGEMTSNGDVRKISFTGSTAVGKQLMRESADTVKRLSLELGGNSPFIVFDDADIDAAVEGALAAKFRNSGQTCVCANRLLVQSGAYEEFTSKFVKAVQGSR
jgi:succinate-semialdehyde dehydrogenase/glutarate-semialdehyde dehydrogenase